MIMLFDCGLFHLVNSRMIHNFTQNKNEPCPKFEKLSWPFNDRFWTAAMFLPSFLAVFDCIVNKYNQIKIHI